MHGGITVKIYIDGSAGTTGLALEHRLTELAAKTNIQLIKPDDSLRKDDGTRSEYLNRADVAFLCLPEDEAQKAVSMLKNPDTVLIDASTAHRTAHGWAYGFAEISDEHRTLLETANRIAVPGCHASGFIALVYPLIKKGLVDTGQLLYCHSLTGYSGGGKAMIEEYESTNKSAAMMYALELKHKHLPEMKHVCGLNQAPVFAPVVVNARQGMIVTVPLQHNAEQIWNVLNEYYKNAGAVIVRPFSEEKNLCLEALNGTDNMELFVFGDERQTLLAARLDNLGKGSSGAAIQCMKVRMNL
jgi:N-acetyl-gamma-glutamyl-phosphate reductase